MTMEKFETMENIRSVKKVFWENPYQTEINAKVTSIKGNEITVDQTIFYAFSGGQESDEGTIGGKKVLGAKKEGKNIVYTLDDTDGLKVGQEVEIRINEERRLKLMRLHFATEIVLVLIYRNLPSIEKIGAHIAEDKARIDFRHDGNLAEILSEILGAANKMIGKDELIVSDFSDMENELRYWEISEFAKVPCGGTHPKRTGEIGSISLKRKTAGKGKERVEIYLA